ncbi:hypothetical protein GB937_000026 [Aspergillus fischeri]|nr:hypothetical protein GB937_000026 [Aspergillus fischeri]
MHVASENAHLMWNPDDPSTYLIRNLAQRLGYSSHSSIPEIGIVNLTVYLRTPRVQDIYLQYGNMRQPGRILVGLENKAKTGWLNVLLQTYYHINAFRSMVYKIPTSYNATADIVWALQRTFHAMQISQVPVSTDELISAMGCRVGEAQDAQDKALLILYLLEKGMEAREVGGNLKRLFEGQLCTYQYALDSYQGSSRCEMFWDLSLNIRPYRSLAESLRDYIQPLGVEDSHLLGRGQRGTQVPTIDRFPPVLHLHLKRYEYNLKAPRFVKDDSLWEFPDEIDLAPFLSFSADKSEPSIYRLFAVITHEGNENGGVYYVYLRPTGDGPFVKFHDEQVTPASSEEVFDTNFGEDYGDMYGASKSAYILFYCRVSRLQELFGDITDADLPSSVGYWASSHRCRG